MKKVHLEVGFEGVGSSTVYVLEDSSRIEIYSCLTQNLWPTFNLQFWWIYITIKFFLLVCSLLKPSGTPIQYHESIVVAHCSLNSLLHIPPSVGQTTALVINFYKNKNNNNWQCAANLATVLFLSGNLATTILGRQPARYSKGSTAV